MQLGPQDWTTTNGKWTFVMESPVIATVVFPARDFHASVQAWSTVFGAGPAFSSSGIERAPGEADFAVFKTADIEIGLTSLPWVDEPLVMFDTDDIAESRRTLIDPGQSRICPSLSRRSGRLPESRGLAVADVTVNTHDQALVAELPWHADPSPAAATMAQTTA